MPYPEGAFNGGMAEPVAADLMPEEDFSSAGIARRRWQEIDAATKPNPRLSGPTNRIAAEAFYRNLPEQRQKTASRLRELTKNTQAQNLSRYPEIQKAVISAVAGGAAVRDEDIARLINVKEATSAAKMLLAAHAIGDEQRQQNILATASPIMRSAIYEIADNLIEQNRLAMTPRSEPQKAGFDAVVNTGANALGKTLEFLGDNLGTGVGSTFKAMEAGWENLQQTWRAGVLVDNQVLSNPLTTVFIPARVAMNWGKTGKGTLNEGYLQSLKDSGNYSPVAVDILADISRANASGDPEPIITVMTSEKYAGNAEASEILRSLIYRDEYDPQLEELARQIDSANQGSAGQILNSQIGSIGANPAPGQDPIEAYSEARGSKAGEIGANVANVSIGLVADPFLGLSKVRGAYLGVRYALNKLAPGMDIAAALASKKIAGIETNATRIFFQRFVDDLGKLDELEQSDKVAAASFRQIMARQYKDLPDDVVEEFRTNGVRSVDDVVDVINESNGMFKMLNGEVADEAAALLRAEQRAAATPMQRDSMFGRMMASGNAGRREPLMPRLTVGGILRQDAARIINSRFMPSLRAEAVIQSSYSDLDPVTVAEALNDNYKTIGRMDASRTGIGRGGAFADRLTRMLSSLPGQSFIRIDSTADAGTFYKMARTFLTKRHADVLTEAFREANPGQRRLLIAGVVRSSAASRGVDLSKEEVLAKIDELVTGGMEGEQYAASQVVGPAVRAAASGTDEVVDGSPASPMKIIEDFESTTTYNPAVVNGRQHALHNYQVAKAVAIPSIGDIEAIKRYRSMVPEWLQNKPQQITDLWSLGTLYGFRFSQRSMIEDIWAYAITGGSLPNLIAGRRASTAIREATPLVRLETKKVNGVDEFVRDADGNLKIIVDSRLGMVNKRLRGIGWKQQKSQNDSILGEVLGQFFIQNLDEEQILAAFAASRLGDMAPLQGLVQLAFAKQIIKVSPEHQKYILRLVGSPTGIKTANSFAETGRFLNQGTTPKVTGGIPGSDVDGVQLVTTPGDARTVFGNFIDIPMDGTSRYGNMFWHRNLLAAVEYDGPIGKIAVANLYNKESAIQKIVDAINADKRFGYKDNFSMLYTGEATVEEFARRYFDDVYGMFAGKNGINRKLWESVVKQDETGKVIVSMYTKDEDGNKVASVTQEMLAKFDPEEKPAYVLGREVNAMPMAANDNAMFSDKMWGWMGEQYARISKEPILYANYIEQSEFLQPFEKQLAASIGDKAAARLTTKWAEDRAYAFSLNYTDNPMNRSLMAWKVRNVARYYRATEDFYRRMSRVAVNYPIGFWRTALTYQLLDETGFVYTDQNGDKYFAYPGNEFLMTTVNKVLSVGLGRQTAAEIDPFFVGGKITGLAPSSDPKQALPSLSGPLSVIGFKMLFDRFDSLAQFEKYVTGEYSVNASYWDALIPASINRVIKSTSQDERDSLYGSAMMDSFAIAAANDMIPEGATTVDDIKNSDLWPILNNIATSIVVTKLLMSYFVPASPQVYTDNVTAFARANGLSSMRQTFLALVQKYAESDNPAENMNPMGAAMRQWYVLHPEGNLMPFTVSQTENKQIVANLANVQTTDKMESWYRENKWLWKKYPNEAPEAALWLAPRDGEFVWPAWQLATNELGLKQGKEFNTFATDVLASKTQFEYFATIDDYAEDIAAQDPRTSEGRAAITKLEADRKLDLETIANRNPFFLDKNSEMNWSKKDRQAQVAFDNVKTMVSQMYKNGDATDTSTALYNAILTYEDYMADIKMITGSTNADDASKRQLRFELASDLEALAANNQNVAQFVQTVLRRTPDFVALSTATGGMN